MTPLRVKAAFLIARPMRCVPCLERFAVACLVSLDMLQLGHLTALQTDDCQEGCSSVLQHPCFIVHKGGLVLTWGVLLLKSLGQQTYVSSVPRKTWVS